MRSLTNLGKRVHQVTRQVDDSGKWVDGEWVQADRVVINIYANIQPSLLSYQSKMLPESEREKEAIAVRLNDSESPRITGEIKREDFDDVVIV